MNYILIFLLITYFCYSKQYNENLLFENVSYIYASKDENNFSKIIMIYNNSYEEYSNELILEKKYNLTLSFGEDTKTCKLENEIVIINKTHYEIINSENTSVYDNYCLNNRIQKSLLSCSNNKFITVCMNYSDDNCVFLLYSVGGYEGNVSINSNPTYKKECISISEYFLCCVINDVQFLMCSIIQSNATSNWKDIYFIQDLEYFKSVIHLVNFAQILVLQVHLIIVYLVKKVI